MKRFISIIFLFLSVSVIAQKHFIVKPLTGVNSEYQEMSPVPFGKGIVFSSNRPRSAVSVKLIDDATPYNLYYAEPKGRRWGKPMPFAKAIKTPYSESSATFSESQNILYFTQRHNAFLSPAKFQSLELPKEGIFQATFTGKEWMLTGQFIHNDKDYNVKYPSLTADEKQLYFCSDMPGGYGGYDIYVCNWENGRWSEPQNMGPIINSTENDIFPFYHANGKLYFSSRGHHDANDLDIFYTEVIDGDWIRPVAMPALNRSRRDDFGFVLSAKMDTGYFTSNRRGPDNLYIYVSSFPSFKECPDQLNETFCYDFEETGTMDIDTTSIKYEWDFGDGHKSRSFKASHCYREIGTYEVALNVIDTLTGDIYFSEASYTLEVVPVEQAYITAPDTAFVNDEIQLNSSESVIRSFPATDYYWDLGDGNIETGTEIDYTYSKPGKYYIRLGITSGEDNSDSDEVDYSNRACSQREIIVLQKREE